MRFNSQVNRKVASFLIPAMLLFVISPANASVKEGTSCIKLGQTVIQANLQFKCVKAGKKFQWSRGIKVKKPQQQTPPVTAANSQQVTPAETKVFAPKGYSATEGDRCSPESDFVDRVGYSTDSTQLVLLHCLLEGRWFDYGKLYPIKINQLTGEILSGALYSNSLKYGKNVYKETKISDLKPSTVISQPSSNLPVSDCRIPQPNPNQGLHRGFNYGGSVSIKPTTVFQVIPLQGIDSSSLSNPKEDYRDFFAELKDYGRIISDGRINFEIRSPDTYIKMNRTFEGLKVGSNFMNGENRTPEQENFVSMGLSLATGIDLDSADIFIFVAPPSTPSSLFARFSNGFNVAIGNRQAVKAFSITKNDPAWGSAHHDLFHLGLAIPDHYGDEKFNGIDSDQLSEDKVRLIGTDRWGNMSGTSMDWLAWDKWLGGFLADSQIICATIRESETFYIKPSSIYKGDSKLLLIPTGQYTAIAVESMRNFGFNHSLPESLMGALVYSIDTRSELFGGGVDVLRPLNRVNSSHSPAPGDDALRINDRVRYWGYQIEVLEAGEFGDVVKVSRI